MSITGFIHRNWIRWLYDYEENLLASFYFNRTSSTENLTSIYDWYLWISSAKASNAQRQLIPHLALISLGVAYDIVSPLSDGEGLGRPCLISSYVPR